MTLYIPPEPVRERTQVETTALAVAAWLQETIGARASSPLTQSSRTSILITLKEGKTHYLSFEPNKLHIECSTAHHPDWPRTGPRNHALDYNEPNFPDRLINLLQGRTDQQTADNSQENERRS